MQSGKKKSNKKTVLEKVNTIWCHKVCKPKKDSGNREHDKKKPRWDRLGLPTKLAHRTREWAPKSSPGGLSWGGQLEKQRKKITSGSGEWVKDQIKIEEAKQRNSGLESAPTLACGGPHSDQPTPFGYREGVRASTSFNQKKAALAKLILLGGSKGVMERKSEEKAPKEMHSRIAPNARSTGGEPVNRGGQAGGDRRKGGRCGKDGEAIFRGSVLQAEAEKYQGAANQDTQIAVFEGGERGTDTDRHRSRQPVVDKNQKENREKKKKDFASYKKKQRDPTQNEQTKQNVHFQNKTKVLERTRGEVGFPRSRGASQQRKKGKSKIKKKRIVKIGNLHLDLLKRTKNPNHVKSKKGKKRQTKKIRSSVSKKGLKRDGPKKSGGRGASPLGSRKRGDTSAWIKMRAVQQKTLGVRSAKGGTSKGKNKEKKKSLNPGPVQPRKFFPEKRLLGVHNNVDKP